MKRIVRTYEGPGNKRLIRSLAASALAGALIIQGAAGVTPSRAHAEPVDLSITSVRPGSKLQIPDLKPAWTAQVDDNLESWDYFDGKQRAVAEDGKVFTFAGAKLIAFDAATGKRLWTYGKEMAPYIVYANGVVYGLTEDRRPYAIDAKTGKALWQSAKSIRIDARYHTEALIPKADALYAISGSQLYAFDPQTGKLRWIADEPSGEGNGTAYLEEADGVLLRTFMVQGALSAFQLDAFDKKTGKKLWGDFGQREALWIKDGLVYSVDDYSYLLMDFQSLPDRQITIKAYNLKTGALKGTREYKWKVSGEPPYPLGAIHAKVNGDKLYVDQGDQIAEYGLNTYKAGAAPLRTFWKPSGENWSWVKVVQDRLVFHNWSTGELKGIKLANGQSIDWNGDAPAAQIDVYGKGIYRAQRNGTLIGINMLTSQPAFRVTTGSDFHWATLKTGDMLVIHSEGKLLGVKLPASLR